MNATKKNNSNIKEKKTKKKKSMIRRILLTSIITVAVVCICIISIIVFFVVDNYYFSENENNDVYNFNQHEEYEFYQSDEYIIPVHEGFTVSKPNIYLYPEEETEVLVELDFKWEIFADYPKYDENIGGWEVLASPDGKIINKADNKEYSYLFWEWNIDDIDWDVETWFVVAWSETREFLQEILPSMWLTPVEYNEFIVYWYPLLQENPYNLIHFADTQYTDLAPLSTSPRYDSLLRVFMLAKPLQQAIEIEPQVFPEFQRNGFTVVEWGGSIIQ